MNPQTKFKLKAYLFYIVFEPWVSKFHIPNLRVLNWVAILLSIFIFKSLVLVSIFVAVGIFFHMYGEWRNGKFIFWFRMRKPEYRKFKETIKKVREERRIEEPYIVA